MKKELVNRATDWYCAHQKHCRSLKEDAWTSFEPSDEDKPRPELWKGGHWLWFEETYYTED